MTGGIVKSEFSIFENLMDNLIPQPSSFTFDKFQFNRITFRKKGGMEMSR